MYAKRSCENATNTVLYMLIKCNFVYLQKHTFPNYRYDLTKWHFQTFVPCRRRCCLTYCTTAVAARKKQKETQTAKQRPYPAHVGGYGLLSFLTHCSSALTLVFSICTHSNATHYMSSYLPNSPSIILRLNLSQIFMPILYMARNVPYRFRLP